MTEPAIAEIREYYQLHGEWPSQKQWARTYQHSEMYFRRRGGINFEDALSIAKKQVEFEAPELPDGELDIDELLARRENEYQRKAEYEQARQAVPVKVNISGPVGIIHFGDPHLDDPGSDMRTLREHRQLVLDTPGLMAANVGDSTNNWIGRLARLYGEQETTAMQSIQLLEWFIADVPWLYLIAGNHDCLDMETEALTRRGWKKYHDITYDDEVYSYDRKRNVGRWTPILQRINRRNTEQMVRLKNQNVDMLVTPNHRVLCEPRPWTKRYKGRYTYARANKLPARFNIPCAVRSVRNGVDLSDSEIRMAAWVLTDGSIFLRGKTPRIEIYQSKQHSIIEDVLDGCGYAYSTEIRHREVTEICGNTLKKAVLPQRTYTICRADSIKALKIVPEKGKPPEWASRLTDRQFDIFLAALVNGDGSWASNGLRSAGVIYGEKPFLDALQGLFVQYGLRCSLITVPGRDNDHRLNFCYRDTAEINKPSCVSTGDAVPEVWCLTVPFGNFMVRRNGVSYFTGNCWAGHNDPFRWIVGKQHSVTARTQVRLCLRFPRGRNCLVNARHDFPGHSMWNLAHGPMKAAQMGWRDDILTCGHRHCSGYGILKSPADGKLSHCIRIASYKRYDEYAKGKGLPDQNISPAVVTIINPLADRESDFVTVFHDVFRGADYLTYLRKKEVA